MNADRAQESSLRLGRPEISRLVWALAISLALHLGGYGGYELGKKFHIWQNLHWPKWIQRAKVFAAIPKQPAHPPVQQEVPLMFVDVNPQQATPEAPKNAKFYSSKNSQAANPDVTLDTEMPKISGKQTDVVKTEDTPRAKLEKLQPNIAELANQREAEQAKPEPKKAPGDLVMTKPDVTLRQEDGFTEHSRPRTLQEARMRQNRTQLVGEKMKQDGGVKRHSELTSLDTKSTLTGSYDEAFIDAITSHWFDLLEKVHFTDDRQGKVAIQFRLYYDGRITDVMVVESTMGEMHSLLCQKAIVDPAPYEKWPAEMRRALAEDYRELLFTFLYR